MGWGQPNGKRTRHCSDENRSDFSGEAESISNKDMKSPFGKRHREASPSRMTEKASLKNEMSSASSQVVTVDVCSEITPGMLCLYFEVHYFAGVQKMLN